MNVINYITSITESVELVPAFIVIVHLLACIGIGFYHFRKIKTGEDFCTLQYTKNIPTILVCTIFATAIGGGTIIGAIDEICRNHMFLFFLLSQPFLWIITQKVVLSGIGNFKECTTLTQILNKLFERTGKFVGFYGVIIDAIKATSIQVLAFGTVCQFFFGIDLLNGMIIGIVVINTYSMLGGLRGIIAIDVFQFLIFFAVIPASYVYTIITNSNLTEPFFTSFDVTNFKMEINPLLSISLLITSLLPEFSAPFMQRYLVLASHPKELKSVFKKLFMITVPFMMSIALIAYLIIVNSGGNPPTKDAIFSYISLLSPILKGMMISGIFAILMSTADSFMNATSVIITNDFLKPTFKKSNPKLLLILMRVIIGALSLISLGLVAYSEQLFKLFITLAHFGPYLIIMPLSAAFLGFKVTRIQFLSSISVSVVFMLTTMYLNHHLIISLTGFIGSLVGLILGRKDILFNKERYQIFTFSYYKTIFSTWKQKLNACLASGEENQNGEEKSIILAVLKAANNTIKSKSTISRYFGVFILGYYIIFSLYLDSKSALLGYLVIAGYISAIILLLKDVLLPKKLLKYSYIYYFTCITFCLPVTSSYMLFHYISAANNNYIWIINSLLTTFLLYQFLNSVVFLLSMTVGFICGYVIYLLESGSGAAFGYTANLVLYVYISLLFMSQVIARDKEKKESLKDEIQKRKFNMIQSHGEIIAHDVRTPVTITSLQTSTFREVLATIKESDNDEYRMSKKNYEILSDATERLEAISEYAVNVTENLLESLKSSLVDEDKKVVLVKDLIDDAIKEYDKNIQKVTNLTTKIVDNFGVHCSPISIKHVLINLLKNAHKHNHETVKIEITADDNKIYFKDYGKGIPKYAVEKIFTKFYTDKTSGIGIGLSFCKIAMLDIGGVITCESEVGKYTNFILEFSEGN